ncbi:hypothetical protein ACN38_g3367 [Penicillium nordicum]|uniref:Uncharacterized protein n=1 Tax=Penicillium nordicum TaxID=229535 RepID=A0A0M9WI45_9EURO|nr:hypothetical protein ACN38_g3367 [Penicillium nordicum]
MSETNAQFSISTQLIQVSSHIHMSTPSIPASPVLCTDLSKHTTQNNRTILHLQIFPHIHAVYSILLGIQCVTLIPPTYNRITAQSCIFRCISPGDD